MAFRLCSIMLLACFSAGLLVAAGPTKDKLFRRETSITYTPEEVYSMLIEISFNEKEGTPREFLLMVDKMIEVKNMSTVHCTESKLYDLAGLLEVPYDKRGTKSIENYIKTAANRVYQVCKSFLVEKVKGALKKMNFGEKEFSRWLTKAMFRSHMLPEEFKRIKYPYPVEEYQRIGALSNDVIDWTVTAYINTINPLQKLIGPRNGAWWRDMVDEFIRLPCRRFIKNGLDSLAAVHEAFIKPGIVAYNDSLAWELKDTLEICKRVINNFNEVEQITYFNYAKTNRF